VYEEEEPKPPNKKNIILNSTARNTYNYN